MTARKPKEEHLKRGRHTAYSVEMAEKAYSLAQQGMTIAEISESLGISVTSFYEYKSQHPEFAKATALGKEAADDRVEEALYHRARGYSHKAVKIFMPANAAAPVYAEYVEHYPPDTQAASLWLRNRRPEKWRDKQDVEHSGKLTLEQLVGDSLKPEDKDGGSQT